MAAYGKGQMLGSGINPESFKQDYSGFANAAAMQAQGIANLGQSIGGAIQDYGKMKQEQKRVDAMNKAASKAIESAITLGKSYEISGVEETLQPFLAAANDPSLSPIEKAALLDEGKAMIPNVFGRFDKNQAMLIEQAQNEAAAARAAATSNRPMTLAEIAMGGGKQQVMLDPTTGVAKPITLQGFDGQPQQASVLGNLPQPLKPYAKAFEEAGVKYGVPPALLAAISMHETGGGTSSAFRNKNNAMGISDSSGPIQVAKVEDSIERMANLLGRGINQNTGPYAGVKTVEDIGRIYAPVGASNDPRNLNPAWSQGVTSQLQKLMQTQQPAATPAQGRVGFTPDETEETKGLTKEQVVAAGLPEGNYVGKFRNGQLIFATPIPAKEDPIATERSKVMDAPNIALFEAGQTATQRLPNIQEAYNLLESDSVKTGTLAEYKVAAKRLFNQDVSNEEQFMSLVGNLAMEAIDLTKGAISNQEMTFFREQLAPSLNKSVEGNKKILKFKIDKAKRDIQISKKVSELFEKKASPSEIQAEVAKIMDKNPLVTGLGVGSTAPTGAETATSVADLIKNLEAEFQSPENK